MAINKATWSINNENSTLSLTKRFFIFINDICTNMDLQRVITVRYLVYNKFDQKKMSFPWWSDVLVYCNMKIKDQDNK